jgi:hypothetical protein
VLRYNPKFIAEHVSGPKECFCLIMHEIMHPMFGHFIYKNGPLENLAADMVINASISLLFPNESDTGSLFAKLYPPHGIEGLLRPYSRMGESRYFNLYQAFYPHRHGLQRVSTGEAIQALKVLTPSLKTPPLLLGNHLPDNGFSDSSSLEGISADSLARIAEDIRNGVRRPSSRRSGYGEELYEYLMEVLNTHLTLKRTLLRTFLTKRKVDRFIEQTRRRSSSVSPIPLHPSKRDLVLLMSDVSPIHFHNHIQRIATTQHGLAVYLDVSGSVNEYLPKIIGILKNLRSELMSLFLFSNKVVETPFQMLLSGHVQTTYGTDFNCIAESIIERDYDKAVVITDGYASLENSLQEELRKRRVRILTILFDGKTECEEFEPFGDAVQLEDVTE